MALAAIGATNIGSIEVCSSFLKDVTIVLLCPLKKTRVIFYC